MVSFENTYGRSKRVDNVVSKKANASEEDVRKMSRGIMLNHQDMAGSLGLNGAAKNLVGSDGLEGLSAALGDVERLAPELSDGEMPEEEPEEGEGDGCDEPKAPKWWDQSRALNKAHNALVQTYDKLHENAKAELKKMQELRKQYQKCSVKERQQMAGDAQILQTRMMCLEKVFDTAESLQGFINGFDATPVPDSASLTSDSMGLLGKAAPCANFRKLKVFRDLRSDIEKTWECKTLEELEAHKSSWGDLKAPVSDLVAACKSAGSDLSRSFKAVQKAQSQIQAAKAKPAKKGATAGTSGVGGTLFQLLAKLEAVEQICEGEPLLSTDVPMLIRSKPENQMAFENLPSIKTPLLEEFLRVFAVQASAHKLERADKRYPEHTETFKAMSMRMASILSQTAVAATDVPQDLKAALEVQAVIVQKNVTKVSSEKHFAGAVRLTMSGSREVIAVPLRAMAEHLGATDLKSARDLLTALDEPKLAKLISNGVKVYATKTSKGDALYIPSAYIFAERVVGASPWMGVRAGALVASLSLQSDLDWLMTGWAKDDEVVRLLRSCVQTQMAAGVQSGVPSRQAEQEALTQTQADKQEQQKDEQEAAQRKAAEEDKRKQEEQEAAQRQLEEEKRKQEEHEAMQRKAAEEDKRKQEEQEAVQRKAAEEEKRRQDEHEAAQRQMEEEKRKQEEQEAKRKQAEQEAIAKQAAEEKRKMEKNPRDGDDGVTEVVDLS